MSDQPQRERSTDFTSQSSGGAAATLTSPDSKTRAKPTRPGSMSSPAGKTTNNDGGGSSGLLLSSPTGGSPPGALLGPSPRTQSTTQRPASDSGALNPPVATSSTTSPSPMRPAGNSASAFSSPNTRAISSAAPATSQPPDGSLAPTHRVTLKLLLLGEHRVGKTCIARYHIPGPTPVTYKATIGVDFYKYTFLAAVKGRGFEVVEVVCHLYDLAGQDRDQSYSLNPVLARGAKGILAVADYTTLDGAASSVSDGGSSPGGGGGKEMTSSLHSALAWRANLPDVPAVLLVNKCDLEDRSLVKRNQDAIDRVVRPPMGSPASATATSSGSTAFQGATFVKSFRTCAFKGKEKGANATDISETIQWFASYLLDDPSVVANGDFQRVSGDEVSARLLPKPVAPPKPFWSRCPFL